MNIVETYHKELLKYKNKHNGEIAYIFGSGPTLKQFKMIEKGYFIGCNHIIKNEYIKKNLKYYFFGDGYIKKYSHHYNPIYGDHKKEVDNLDLNIEKFCMVSRNNDLKIHGFTKKTVEELNNINTIPCDLNLNIFFENLEKNPFMNHSIIFPAIQFALYSGFSKIYLVGCDCTGYFLNNGFNTSNGKIKYDEELIMWHKKLLEHKIKYYNNSKIISINPVGLKDIYDEDIYV